jgi:hypothetical protein
MAATSSVVGVLKRRACSPIGYLSVRMTTLYASVGIFLKCSLENMDVSVVLMKHLLYFGDDILMCARNITTTLPGF